MRAPFRRDQAEPERMTPNAFGPNQPHDCPTPVQALAPHGDPCLSVLDAEDDTEDLYLDLGVGD